MNVSLLLFIFLSLCEKKREDPIPIPVAYHLSDSIDTNEQIISSSLISNLEFINKEYTKKLPGNNQVYIKKESTISQISGCNFTNIELPNPYFIILDKEVLLFDNNIEFSTFGDYPAPVYLNDAFHGNINISHCVFIKCKSRKNDGNVLNCIGEADIIFESCKLMDCGNDNSQAILKLQGNNNHLVNISNCTFKFHIDTFSCNAIEAKTVQDIIFDHCSFFRCPVAKVYDNTKSFQFTNNFVYSIVKQIIFINYVKFNLNISSNSFQNSHLIYENFISLIHNINEIILFNNSFSGFIFKGNKIINFERYTKAKTNLVINKCHFINNENDHSIFQIGHSSSPANLALNFSKCKFIKNICYEGNGGAISLNINQELSLTNCYFINNKALFNGGAIALYKIKRINIISCTFKENEANYNLSSFDIQNYKNEGRGGALYIYSSFSYIKNDYTKILNCTFASNSAFDGYAIYIKGNDNGKKYIINQNTFNDNYDKNSNSRCKGVITSEIMNINNNDNVSDSNIFTSKDGNFLNSIIYVNHTLKIHHLIIGLVLLIIIIIIIYFIKNENNSKQDNTFIFVILDSSARKTNQKNITKYDNYYFSSYALLIKRLAINHLKINKQHILIFGRGEKEKYNINSLIPNNKIIIQLTIDEIYETESSQFELNITPYKNIEDIIISMRSCIDLSNCNNPNIILFLYDHDDRLKFLELYLKISNIPHHSLYIYNDSYKSYSMILKIKNYFAISEIISSFSRKITQDELFFIASVAKEIYPKGNFVQLDAIQSLDRKYFKYISKRKIDNTFYFLCLFAKGEIQLDQLYQNFPSFFMNYDINSLAKIVQCFIFKYRIPDDYEVIHLIFEKGIKVIKKALKKFNFTNEQFMSFINNLKDNKQNFADKQYKMHPNHFIVTSSHENGLSPTYGTIRVNEDTKIIPGSPAMASYIIEALMNRSLGKKSINRIKKNVYGDHEGSIMEYATQCFQLKKKKWVRLNINYWESRFIFTNKILNDQDTNFMAKHRIEEVMKSVGFKLLSRCKIEFDKQNKCVTKKMQPLFKMNKKLNVIGIRLVDINMNVDYSLDDEYYSDANDQHESNNNSPNNDNNNNHIEDNNWTESNNNYLNVLDYSKNIDDTNYDSVITKKQFNKIIREVKIEEYMIYPVRFLVIFDYELHKIAENNKFNKKYPNTNQKVPTKIPPDFRLNMSN